MPEPEKKKEEWTYMRLFQAKKDVHDLVHLVENIVEFGFSREQIEEILASNDISDGIKDLANNELVKRSGDIKSHVRDFYEFIRIAKIKLPESIQRSLDDDIIKFNRHQLLKDFNKTEDLTFDGDFPPQIPKLIEESILVVLFTHKSMLGKSPYYMKEDNEKLKLLGETVLTQIVTREIYKTYPNLSVEYISALRAQIVSTENLIKWAKLYQLESYSIDDLKISEGTDHEIYGDLIKAYAGGLYVDSEYEWTKLNLWFNPLLKHYFSTVDLTKLELTKETSQQPQQPQQPQQQSQHTLNQANLQSTSQHNAAIPQQPGTNGVNPSTNNDTVRFSKEALYKRVCLSFVPNYVPINKRTTPGAPNFRIACLLHGEVIGVGEGDSSKTAGTISAYNAITYNSEAVDRFSRLSRDVKAKRTAMPLPLEIDISQQLLRFPENGAGAPF